MAASYIPDSDEGARTWVVSSSANRSSDPARGAISPAQAADVAASVLGYSTALDVAKNPATRTKGTIEAKRTLKSSAEQICRQVAMLIRNNAGVSDEDKLDLGINPINNTKSPIHVPTTSPGLQLVAGSPGAITVRYTDPTVPEGGIAKPFGAKLVAISIAISDEPVMDPGLAIFYANYTRNPCGIGFSHADDGKLASIFAQWVSPTGQLG